MNETISRLIYISSNQIEGDDERVKTEIDGILRVAREANTAVGITGALMFNDGCFAQVLEGGREHIEDTFERIQCDERHSDVVILSFEDIEQRGFSSWSMGYVGSDATAQQAFETIRIDSGFDASKIPSGQIFSLLQQNLQEAESNAGRFAA